MNHRIESLEGDKKSLEEENAREAQENRKLLDDLEELNVALADSQNHIKSLEAILQSAQQELHRFESFAERTQDLEVQIAVLEQEQAILQRTIATSEAEERAAIRRWKSAEQALIEVQEQLETIEREAMEERKRHIEVVGRLERLRSAEKELESAAGRLKGTATAGQDNNGSYIGSHFVKDILQDNTNLQLGIIELREMLMNSNDEVQSLREQLTLHQPLHDRSSQISEQPTLEAELARSEPNVIPQELHIHHHYHAQARRGEPYRPKKKRNTMNPASIPSPSGAHSLRPSKSLNMRPASSSRAAAILSQTPTPGPRPVTPTNRWSTQSMQTLSDLSSSAPSSPQSAFRTSAIFDRGHIDQTFDLSQPTSPASSVGPLSPIAKPGPGPELSTRYDNLHLPFQPNNVIYEEDDNGIVDAPGLHLITEESTVVDKNEKALIPLDPREQVAPESLYSSFTFQPSIRRSVSHESILSIAGLDAHALMSGPSQVIIAGTSPMLRPGSRLGYNNNQPIISPSTIVARPTLSRRTHDSSSYLRLSMGLSDRPTSRSANGLEGGASLGKKIGGWVWGRWGVTPTPSPLHIGGGVGETPKVPTTSQRPPSKLVGGLIPPIGPSTGTNQDGSFPSLRKMAKVPSKDLPDIVGEVLME